MLDTTIGLIFGPLLPLCKRQIEGLVGHGGHGAGAGDTAKRKMIASFFFLLVGSTLTALSQGGLSPRIILPVVCIVDPTLRT